MGACGGVIDCPDDNSYDEIEIFSGNGSLLIIDDEFVTIDEYKEV